MTSPEIKELFVQLKHHDTMHRELDEKIAKECIAQIADLLKQKYFKEAKNFVYDFYKDYADFTFEKDMILANINHRMNHPEITD